MRLREFFRELLIRTTASIVGPDLERVGITAEEAGDLVWSTLNGIGIEAAFSDARERGDRAVKAFRKLAEIALGDAPHDTKLPRR
jgi:hypothetical protein